MNTRRFSGRWRSAVHLALLTVVATPAFGYMLAGWAWPSGSITVHTHLDDGQLKPPGSATWASALTNAIEQWNGSLVRSQLVSVPASSSDRSDDNLRNDIHFTKQAFGEDWDEFVLGYTYCRYFTTQAFEADIIVNANEQYSIYTGPTRTASDGTMTHDIRRLLLHELGHLLGLWHPDEDGQKITAIMNSTLSNVDKLQADDKEGIRVLYGKTLAAPTITAEPADQTVETGSPLQLSYDGAGEDTVFLWRYGPTTDATTILLNGDGDIWDLKEYTLAHAQPEDSGLYFGVAANWAGVAVTRVAQVTVNPPAADPKKRLVNLSTRGRAGNGADQLIAGFYVNGSRPKRLLIRAIGPTLAQAPYNVPGAAADVTLTVQSTQGDRMGENDDWGRQENAADIALVASKRGASAIPSESKDAALLLTLPPGGYTALVNANGGPAGVALVEVYEADVMPEDSDHVRLTNIATRGWVGRNADKMIAGFYVTGSAPKQLVIRAIGPSLAQWGVPDVNTDTALRLYNAAGQEIAYNDDWYFSKEGDRLLELFPRVGASALETLSWDAALVVTLPPGAYTAMVEGRNEEMGIALVEVFEVSTPQP